MGYAVPATVFPASAHYVALGHLHRAQQVPGPCPVRYSGSPLAVDFGEEENAPSVSIVEVTRRHRGQGPGRADHGGDRRCARSAARSTELADARRRRTRGCGCSCARRPGPACARRCRTLLPRALEVRIDPAMLPETPADRPRARSGPAARPRELFADYLDQPRARRRRRPRHCSTELYEEVG